jgi:hypothetical protein
MATFTLALKDVLEMDPTIETEILGTYPLFDEGHRPVLNKKIIDHFWNMEIGVETVSMFRLALARKLNEIMPLYNQHYEISAINFNQLETVRINNTNTATTTATSESASTSGSTSDAKSRAVAQELPQTMLSGNGDYATSAQDNISNTAATGNSSENGSTEQNASADNVTSGFQGNAALMLLQYRQSLVNVDMMIIGELESLFMLLWSNGDEFSNTERGSWYGYFGTRY